ncbi:EPIDERMAL PATTERNING FACTOR-like protein 6 [Benincasa hispida]|uniref:EPIDERMAL PATTERNING FACTOR-like protein 6 n=1 Tax=Benincasa hispida TaxID=102211 RepID=UPI001902B12F|nr:EPIDERMAL PATTERNING FACTOR-like protein 6 [Benincasa hispida]
MEFNRNRVVSENKTTHKPIIFFFFFFFFLFLMLFFILLSFCSSIISSSDNIRRFSSAKGGQHYQYSIANYEDQELSLPRRGLGGLGSSPPRCASKCGKCTPCTAVHVPVSPGTPVTAEYYPEAWRCKCGNKLYMP